MCIPPLRKNREGLLLHLVNVTGDMKRPLGAILPLSNIEISVRAKGRSVKALSTGKKIKFKREHDRIKFIVPKIDEYEIVALEK